MSEWYCEYLLKRSVAEDAYIIVLFSNVELYESRVFLVKSASTPTATFKEIKSYEAERYRDGGSTFISTEKGQISLPYRKDHIFHKYAKPNSHTSDSRKETITVMGGSKAEVFSGLNSISKFLLENKFDIKDNYTKFPCLPTRPVAPAPISLEEIHSRLQNIDRRLGQPAAPAPMSVSEILWLQHLDRRPF